MFPNPGIEPRSPALQTDSLPSEPPGTPNISWLCYGYSTNILTFPFTEFSFSFLFFRNTLAVLDVLEGRTHTISLPINLQTVFLVAEDKWLLVESKTNQWVDLRGTSWSVLSFPASLYIALSACVCVLTFLYLAGETLKKRGGEILNVT